MKVGDLVKFVDGTIIGLVVRTVNHTGFVQVLWLPARTPSPARIKNLEVISEGR